MEKQQMHTPLCFCGYHTDDTTLVNTASGGLATALAEDTIAHGGVVYGVIHSPDFDGAEYARAVQADELLPIRGSKYVDVKPLCEGKNVYEMVLDDLRAGRTVLFTGLPCMAAAMKKRAEQAVLEDNLIIVDLICHGPTSPVVAKEYADMMGKKRGSKVTDLAVRYKKDGNWTPPYLKVSYADGRPTLQPFTATEYGFAFRILAPNRCYSCKFKGDNHYSDLTIGDYWGIDPSEEGYNRHGVSVAICHTDCGVRLVQELRQFRIVPVTYEKAIKGNPYYEKAREKDPRHEPFEKALRSKGLYVACRECMTSKEKLRKIVPQPVVDLLHKLTGLRR